MSEWQMFLEVSIASYACLLTTISVQFYTEIAICMVRVEKNLFLKKVNWKTRVTKTKANAN